MRMNKIFIGTLCVIIIQNIAENEVNSFYCGNPLIGSTDRNGIKDSSFSSSEIFSNTVSKTGIASNARLGDDNGWGPPDDESLHYLQIDLEKLYLICGFVVKGCKLSFVKKYRVHISPDENFLDTWNMVKPDFNGKSKEEVYSETKKRELGRYVRFIPYGFRRKKGLVPCMQVEVYGQPYISKGQKVLVLEDSKYMSFKWWTISAVKNNKVKMKNSAGESRVELQGALNYAQVVPNRMPRWEELTVDTCIIAPGHSNDVYLSGRIVKVNLNTNKFVIEYLKNSTSSTFRREQLQVVFGAWCKKVDQFLRVNSKLCRGEIVQVDTKIVFRAKASSGLVRLSYKSKKEDYVSNKKVDPSNLEKRKSKLLYEDQNQCLETATFFSYDPKTEVFGLGGKITKKAHQVHYADSPTDKGCDSWKIMCWKSRIPFMITWLNCSIGEIWNGKDCVDENECETGMASCQFPAECKNTEKSYYCYCPKGTTKVSTKPLTCNDENECEKNVCGKNFKCRNTIGSYKCQCGEGFQNDSPDSCTDIDECADPKNCKNYPNTSCQNKPGSFICYCKQGYLDAQHSYKDCKDVDECSIKIHHCSSYADCENSVGSYTCTCKKGFSGNGRDCQEILECSNPSIQNKCHSLLGQCVDFIGGYKCECKEGYVGDGIKNCTLADECELGIHKCHKWATCINTEKSYDCGCNNGFIGDGFSCEDVDECTNNQNDCGFKKDGIECINTNGSFKCVCRKGFTGDGNTCANIDECKAGAHNCAKHAICTDNRGSFSCTCKPGFFGKPNKKCTAKTKCMKEKPDCDYSRAKCSTIKNAEGKESYACHCIAGYTGNSTNCIDFDECSTDSSNNCSKDAECINNPGSYECRCKDGFSGDGFTCKDIDECTKKTICPENAICNNFKGSFGCRCKNGFDGQDPFKNCSDVDECLLGACGYTGQTCVNSVGSFECKCSPGFNQVGYAFGEDMCQDINECKTLEKPCGSYNYYKCLNKDGDYTCHCEYGFHFNKEKKTCEDIDECTAEEFPCAEQANCVNNEGDFECVCPEGYEGHGKDYCSANNSPSIKMERMWAVLVTLMTSSLISTLLKYNLC